MILKTILGARQRQKNFDVGKANFKIKTKTSEDTQTKTVKQNFVYLFQLLLEFFFSRMFLLTNFCGQDLKFGMDVAQTMMPLFLSNFCPRHFYFLRARFFQHVPPKLQISKNWSSLMEFLSARKVGRSP